MINKILITFSLILISSVSLFAEDLELKEIDSPTVRYVVDKKLGEGAFGSVFSVHDSHGNKYAIKSYKNHEDDDLGKMLIADVYREFTIGQTLNHPNIVKTYDLFQINNTYYMVMELVEGANLFQTPRHEISHKNAMQASRKLMDVIKYAFSINMLYIDLHGGNVVLNKNDIKFVDVSSFFTIDELLSYFYHLNKPEEKTEQNPIMEEKLAKVRLNPSQIARLDAFFKESPEKMKLLKSINLGIGEHFAGIDSDKEKEDIRNIYLYFYLNSYIESILKILAEVHTKSDCTREDRINHRIRLNTIVWEYQDDQEEGHYFPFDYLLEKISRSL